MFLKNYRERVRNPMMHEHKNRKAATSKLALPLLGIYPAQKQNNDVTRHRRKAKTETPYWVKKSKAKGVRRNKIIMSEFVPESESSDKDVERKKASRKESTDYGSSDSSLESVGDTLAKNESVVQSEGEELTGSLKDAVSKDENMKHGVDTPFKKLKLERSFSCTSVDSQAPQHSSLKVASDPNLATNSGRSVKQSDHPLGLTTGDDSVDQLEIPLSHVSLEDTEIPEIDMVSILDAVRSYMSDTSQLLANLLTEECVLPEKKTQNCELPKGKGKQKERLERDMFKESQAKQDEDYSSHDIRYVFGDKYIDRVCIRDPLNPKYVLSPPSLLNDFSYWMCAQNPDLTSYSPTLRSLLALCSHVVLCEAEELVEIIQNLEYLYLIPEEHPLRKKNRHFIKKYFVGGRR